MTTRWLRPRYAQAPNPFHALRAQSGGRTTTECAGSWSQSEVVDELAEVGAGSVAKCKACVEVLARAQVERDAPSEGG